MLTRRSFVLAASSALVWAGLGFACGEPQAAKAPAPVQAPPGPVDGGVGQAIARPGVTVTVRRLIATRSFGGSVNAARGTFYVTMEIEVQNTGTATPAIGADAMKLDLPDGAAGKPELGGPGASLPSTGPAPGQSTSGWRTLSVPDGTRAATLVFTPLADTLIRIGLAIPAKIEDRTIGV